MRDNPAALSCLLSLGVLGFHIILLHRYHLHFLPLLWKGDLFPIVLSTSPQAPSVSCNEYLLPIVLSNPPEAPPVLCHEYRAAHGTRFHFLDESRAPSRGS